jgi:uncharacterized protein (DUF1501 family)
MKRRDFIQTIGKAGAIAPVLLNGVSVNPLADKSFFSRLAATAGQSDKIMVFIELNGGNDGLNTLIPLDQYSNLVKHRARTLIPTSNVLPLAGTNKTGMHPSLTGLRNMYNDGLVSVVQNVGYPNPDYSHFRSMDIWQTAASSGEQLNTGWMGRYLAGQFAGYPTNYPNPTAPDPLAIQIGIVAPVSLMGPAFPMGISVGNPDDVYDLVNDFVEPAPPGAYGDELDYIRTVMQQTKTYFDVIKQAGTIGQNLSPLYPSAGQNQLADQLKVVAKLIHGGLSTQIYLVSLSGFDTHSNQVEDGDPLNGNHTVLLSLVSEAIYAFQDDITRMGKSDKVCGMTYSEFGRTIADNDGNGTDHGAAAPLFVFGKSVNPGMIGTNAVIPISIDDSADVPMQHDFRSVYASVLKDWFSLPDPQSVLDDPFPILPIFKGSVPTQEPQKRQPFELSNYPNPVATETTITFTIPSGHVSIQLYDTQGRFVRKLHEGDFSAGKHEVRIPREGLDTGTYFYQLRLNGLSVTKKMLVI